MAKGERKSRDETHTLRERAEQQLRGRGPDVSGMPEGEVRALVHELQVHQIELELQNEELRQAQLSLAESRDRYSDLYDFAPVGYVTLDEKGRILEANLTAAAMLGAERSLLVGKALSSFVGRKSSGDLYLHLQAVFSSDTRQVSEVEMKQKDGTPLSVRLESIVPEAGRDRCQMALIDVTDAHAAAQLLQRNVSVIEQLNQELEQRVRKRTADLRRRTDQLARQAGELDQREKRLRAVLNTAADSIITINDRGIIVDLNPATEKMFGYAREELVDQNVSILMPEPYRSEHDGYISRYLTTGEARIIGVGREVEGCRKDGTVFPIDLAVSEIGHLGLFTGIIRDISQRKEIERSLEKSRDNLRIVSSELMLTEERERRQLAQDLHDGLGQTLFLINRKLSELPLADQTVGEARSILDVATRTVNALTFELSPTILRDLGLRPAVKWLAQDLRKRYGLSVEIEDDDKPFELDERVATVTFRSVRELLINVAKHAGTDRASVRFRSADHVVEIAVEDQGRGFDLAAQSDQVEAGHFGLFSIRERLGYLGGTMEMRSAPGKGATMTLTVPLAGGRAASG